LKEVVTFWKMTNEGLQNSAEDFKNPMVAQQHPAVGAGRSDAITSDASWK
jgi:hypothetical protein